MQPILLFDDKLLNELVQNYHSDKRIDDYLFELISSTDIDEQYSASCTMQLINSPSDRLLAKVAAIAKSDTSNELVRRTCIDTLAYNDRQLALVPIFKLIKQGNIGYINSLTLFNFNNKQSINVIKQLYSLITTNKQPGFFKNPGCIELIEQAIISIAVRMTAIVDSRLTDEEYEA